MPISLEEIQTAKLDYWSSVWFFKNKLFISSNFWYWDCGVQQRKILLWNYSQGGQDWQSAEMLSSDPAGTAENPSEQNSGDDTAHAVQWLLEKLPSPSPPALLAGGFPASLSIGSLTTCLHYFGQSKLHERLDVLHFTCLNKTTFVETAHVF